MRHSTATAVGIMSLAALTSLSSQAAARVYKSVAAGSYHTWALDNLSGQ